MKITDKFWSQQTCPLKIATVSKMPEYSVSSMRRVSNKHPSEKAVME